MPIPPPADRTQSDRWNLAVTLYAVLTDQSFVDRVESMSPTDLDAYAKYHNAVSSSQADVLQHMRRWSGTHALLASGDIVRNTQSLFNRLLAGRAPLRYPPPRNVDGDSWYELFDDDSPQPVAVEWVGPSRRARDAGRNIFLLRINNCIYELHLLDQSTWLVAADAAFTPDTPIRVRYGRWPNPFDLTLSVRLPVAVSGELAEIFSLGPWLLSRPWPADYFTESELDAMLNCSRS